ncbi:MAG: methylglutaconyl-CoA hydratase [Myxococcota bacterium]|jgi:methylglutaconyl-CoA hydratase
MNLLTEISGGVARITMNRPEVHNAFDADLIGALEAAFVACADDPSVRAIVLAGAGRSFSAGGDLKWMKSMIGRDGAANREDSLGLARMFTTIDDCPKPVVARIQGAALGGGVGLTAACDIVVAGPRALFGLSEVRLGLAPAVISPFVVRKIGSSKARELFLTGDRFGPEEAQRCGLVHRIVGDEAELDGAVDVVLASVLKGGPQALAACKELAKFADVWEEPAERTTAMIARLRISEEGQEGMRSFLMKRKPSWMEDA